MKKVFVFICLVIILTACTNGNQPNSAVAKALVDTTNYTTIAWKDSVVNFGTIKQGEKIELKFYCKNTGNKPLILVNVKPTCGCTVASYTKEPIAPGAEGTVIAGFNSEHFCGTVHKTVIATANTKERSDYNLQFTGNITDCQSNDKIVQPHPVDEKKKN